MAKGESIEELRLKANLTIPQACRVSNFSRPALTALMDAREIDWFPQGKRRRVITSSIFAYQQRKSEMARAS